MRHTKQTIRLERDGADYLVPKGFADILMHRFLPVLSLTYIAMVIAIAAEKHNLYRYLIEENTAYIRSLFVVIWVSVPGVLWIFLNGNPLLRHVADVWYKIAAFIMILTLAFSFFLFPEGNLLGLRPYFVATIPIFIVIYYFFVKGGLPAPASYPLNIAGFCMLIWGALINVLMS